MKKSAKHFSFLFPVVDFTQVPAMHLTDLEVHAIVYQYPDGSLFRDDDKECIHVDIDSIIYDGKNIAMLLPAIAEGLYVDITVAAMQHGEDKFDEYGDPELENGYEASVHSEEWTNNQAENELSQFS